MKIQNQRKIKEKKGITLIALVLTVIILLILAGVSIVGLTGQGNILENAGNAKQKAQRANLIESAQADIFSEQQKTQDGNISTEKLREILSKYFDGVPETDDEFEENFLDNPDYSLKSKPEYGGQDIEVADVYKESLPEETYNPENLTLGTLEAKNTDKYGWKVEKYDVQYNCGEDLSSTSNIWRLFYQDKKYTYLIADELVGSYKPSDYYNKAEYKDKYSDGTKMSIEGQKLNELASSASLFTADETKANDNIRATVWLTDTSDDSEWSKYKNEDAEFCIGSPTLELFAASFNNNTNTSHNNYNIIVKLEKDGYSHNGTTNRLKKEDSHGIYNKNDLSNWWLASPSGNSARHNYVFYVYGIKFMLTASDITNSKTVRPIVCILTSKFHQKGYDSATSLIDDKE